MKSPVLGVLLLAVLGILDILIVPAPAFAQGPVGTTFTYQGRLTDGGAAASGMFDLQLAVYDASSGGTQLGPTLSVEDLTIEGGFFTVTVDFGAGVFTGPGRWLQIGVRPGASVDPFTVLSPRQPITASPYAIRSGAAGQADAALTSGDAAQLGGVAASQYVVTSDARLSDARPPTAGSSAYVQNGTVPQAGASFNISGNGTAGGTLSGGTVNALVQYNLTGTRVLAAPGLANLFVGPSTGPVNTGVSNTFVGALAGLSNTTGGDNAFFGNLAGRNNNTGSLNAFFGFGAGNANTTACCNAFFGTLAGRDNVTGVNNSFFGYASGANNVGGQDNAFFGALTGQFNTASGNAFFGSNAGRANTTGSDNAFFGVVTGESNTGGLRNAFFGGGAGRNNITANDNSFFGNAAGYTNTSGFGNTFVGNGAGFGNTDGDRNTFVGQSTGTSNTTGNNNTFIGWGAGGSAPDLTNATAIGAAAQVGASNTMVLATSFVTVRVPGDLNVAGTLTANLPSGDGSYIQNRSSVQANSNLHISGDARIGGNLFATGNVFANEVDGDLVRGDIFVQSPEYRIGSRTVLGHDGDGDLVVGRADGAEDVEIFGHVRMERSLNVFGAMSSLGTMMAHNRLRIGTLGTNGYLPLCRNTLLEVAECTDLLQEQSDPAPYSGGLSLVTRLRPMSFARKDAGTRDLGLAAADVATVDPLLVIHNAQDDVLGVKYDRIGVLLVNAIREQQAQIEEQRRQIEALKRMICRDHPGTEACP